jgi:hypothetical protein
MSDIFDALDQAREHALQLDRTAVAATAAYRGAAAERDVALAKIVDLEARLAALSGFDALLRPPAGRVLLGSTVGDASEHSVVSFADIVGRPPAIAHAYATSSAQFARRLAETPAGSIPAINLKPLGRVMGPAVYQRVLNGEADRTLAEVADHIRRYERPLFVIVMHEPENDGSAPSDALYARAYRYCVERMRPNASNAVWVWNVMGWHVSRYDALYPGDDVVDWIASNPYAQNQPVADFAQLIGAFYRWAAPRSKPIMLAEWGVSLGVASQSAIWSTTSTSALLRDLPLVRALVYWDAIGTRDYRLGGFADRFRSFAELPVFDVDVSTVAKGL